LTHPLGVLWESFALFRSRFFWKLFGSYAILVVITTLVSAYFVGRYVERSQWDAKVESLRDQCVLLSPYALNDYPGWAVGVPPEGVLDQVRSMADTNEIRVTFIRRDGLVLLDTAEDPAAMENHRGRPEVQEALVAGVGVSQRFGRTLGADALYAAYVKDPRSERHGVVRVSVRANENLATPRQILARTALSATLAALAALLLGYWGARRMTSPLAEMTEAARAFQEGNYEQRILDLPDDELGDLGRALNGLGLEVRSRVDRLSAERGRLSAMLAGMAEGVLAVGEDDRISFSNRAAGMLFGYSETQAEGRKLWDAVHMPGLVELISQARKADHVVQRELVFAGQGGERRLVAKAHHFKIDRATGAVVVFEDITELRQLERVRRDFVANVSHELKTPLTSIRGYVETLLEGAVHDPDHNVRFLEKIQNNVDRLSDLVFDLLSLARIENQEGRLVRTQVDLGALIAETCQVFEEQVERAHLEVHCDLPSTPCVVWGEERGLAQVLENLLSNAVKYTPAQGRIDIVLRREEGGKAHLMVRDTGVGIPVGDQDRIFERFYRVDKARSNEVGGTGLGLSIVKHQVQAMQGRVGVESRVGKGTCFHVYLECAAGD